MSDARKELQKLEREEGIWYIVLLSSIMVALTSLLIGLADPTMTGAPMWLDILGIFGGGFMVFISILAARDASDNIKTWKYYNEKWHCNKCGSVAFTSTETGVMEPSLVDDPSDSRIKNPVRTYSCAKCGATINTFKLRAPYRPVLNSIRYTCPKCGNRTFYYITKRSAWLTASGWHDDEITGSSLECTKCGYDATKDYRGLVQYVAYRLGVAKDDSNLEEVRGKIERGEVRLAPIIADYYRIRASKDREIEA